MALVPADISEQTTEAAKLGVSNLLAAHLSALRQPAVRGLGMAMNAPHKCDLAAPHEVYTLNIGDLDKGLKGAKPSGWRYLVMQGDQPIAAAGLDRPKKRGDVPAVSSLNTGGFALNSMDALKLAESMEEVQKHDYEVRLLQVPAAYAVALWLHRRSKDLLFPLRSEGQGPFQVDNPKCLSPEEFFGPIQQQIKSVSGVSNAPGAAPELVKVTAKRKRQASTDSVVARKTSSISAKKNSAKKTAAKKIAGKKGPQRKRSGRASDSK